MGRVIHARFAPLHARDHFPHSPLNHFNGLAASGSISASDLPELVGLTSPSITLARSPARRARKPSIASIASTICSSVMPLTPPLCSIFISRGTRACLQLGELCARTDQNRTQNTFGLRVTSGIPNSQMLDLMGVGLRRGLPVRRHCL